VPGMPNPPGLLRVGRCRRCRSVAVRPAAGGAWHARYTLLAYHIGSYIPVPSIDPAAFERVMASEDRSMPTVAAAVNLCHVMREPVTRRQ
jgi:hypothetical protein